PSLPGGANPVMPVSLGVPKIFVSPEDVLWQEPTNNNYTVAFSTNYTPTGVPVGTPSPIVPDLSVSGGATTVDWRYSWMFTGYQTSPSNASTFEGNIVIFENRPFDISAPAVIPFPPGGQYEVYQVAGETVVEAVFGYSANVVPAGGPGYGAGADRT